MILYEHVILSSLIIWLFLIKLLKWNQIDQNDPLKNVKLGGKQATLTKV